MSWVAAVHDKHANLWYACRDTYLHSRNLREASALHRQLVHLLQQMGDKIGAFCAGTAMQDLLRSADTLDKPSPTVLMQLQRAIAAGWADQVSCSPSILE